MKIRLMYSLIISLIFLSISLLSADILQLAKPGTNEIIDYSRYGEFKNINTDKYKYQVLQKKALSDAAGEGIYPNTDVFKDPVYLKLMKDKKLEGSHWNFIDTRELVNNFYKWASTSEDPGVKQYYTGLMFERLGMLKDAIKAYQAVAVHFPKSTGYTYWGSPYYMGPLALDKIEILCRRNPQLGMKLVEAKITVENGYDLDTRNDKFTINPGRIIKVTPDQVNENRITFTEKDIKRSVGGKHVRLVQYNNNHWQLLVDNKPYIVKAVAFSPNKVGLSPDRGTLNPTRDWQTQDFNKNGIIDGLFEAWVDENYNNIQDPEEKMTSDAQLLKEMGCNTFRIYNHVINKKIFKELYEKYGIMLMIGDMAGGYAIESGATWAKGTDYEDPKQQKQMLDNIKKMVLEFKDEPYTLFWVLGNENVFGVGNNSDRKPEAFFSFCNRAAKMIHKLDPNHPVALCNGDQKFLDIIGKFAPDIDIFGANAYRGDFGFGRSFFQNVIDVMDRPVVITEYGCSAYGEGFTRDEILAFQSRYHENNWEDIYFHSAGSGTGNALGGVIFEWCDEWWKANADLPLNIQQLHKEWYASRSAIYKNLQPDKQDTVPQFGAPFIDGWSYEEWYGLFSQGNGSYSPFMRQKRPVYDMYKKIWNE